MAQGIKHSKAIEIFDADGRPVQHTPELIHDLFDQELGGLLGETAGLPEAQQSTLREARRLSQEMIWRGEFNPA